MQLSVGVVGTSVQFVVFKSEFCCSAKFIEGTIHEMTRLLAEGVMFNLAAGADCEIQIPPQLTTATTLMVKRTFLPA